MPRAPFVSSLTGAPRRAAKRHRSKNSQEAFRLTEAFSVGVRLLPRFAAAAAAPAFLCLCPVPKLIVCTITNELVTQILVARATDELLMLTPLALY